MDRFIQIQLEAIPPTNWRGPMATTVPEEKQSPDNEQPWPAFFIPPVGFIQYVNPYAILGISKETPQSDIATAIEKIEGVKDENRIEYVAAEIVSDPVRRLLWHCLRWPDEPPSAWAYVRRKKLPALEGSIAANLLHEVVLRERRGLRGNALQELWESVHDEFDRFVDNKRVETLLFALAERLGMKKPRKQVKAALQALIEVVPNIHAFLILLSAENEQKAFHWSYIQTAKGGSRLIEACLHIVRAGAMRRAREMVEQGNIVAGLAQYLKIAQKAGNGEPQELRRLLFEVSELLTKNYIRCAVTQSPNEVEQTLQCLQAFGEITAFDSRLLDAMGAAHAHAGKFAVDVENLYTAVKHLLRASMCNPDGSLKLEMELGELLTVCVAGVTWSIPGPDSTNLLKRLNATTKDLAAGNSTILSDVYDHEYRTLSGWMDLVIRLDLRIPNDEAILAANALMIELAARAPDEPFATTRDRILAEHPELADAPWKHIQNALRQDTPLSARELAAALPNPRPPLGSEKAMSVDEKVIERVGKALTEQAQRRRQSLRALRAAFFYPWFFSERSGLAKDVLTGFGLALTVPFALAGIAVTLSLAALTLLLLQFGWMGAVISGTIFCVLVIIEAAKAWLGYEFGAVDQKRTLHGLAKFQAVAAIALIAGGLVYFGDKFGREAWHMHQRDKAYTALRNAAATKDTAAVAQSARSFLALTPTDKFDYRTLDVLEKHSDALVREIARAAREERSATLDQLVAEAKAVYWRTQSEKQAWKEIEAAR